MRINHPRTLLVVALVGLAVVGFGLWRLLPIKSGQSQARTILYYQDSMHPWIKSSQPGKCTICSMDLTPIYSGEQGFSNAAGVVTLSSNSVTVVNVQTVEVRKQPLSRVLRVAGNLEADNTRKTVIGAPAPGRIDNVTVASVGVEVKRGQALATFYSPDLTFQTRRYIFRDRLPDRTNEFGPNPFPQVGSSRYALAHPSPLVPRTDLDPFYNDLLAPLAGTVVERAVFDGQYVAEGDRLFVVVDCSVLWFRFDVYEQQLAWLEPGQAVEVTVPAYPDKTFPAVISVIEPTVNDLTRTVKVRADVQNPVAGSPGREQRLLRLGMYAEGRVRSVSPETLVVPRSAILYPGGRAYAYVDRGSGAYEMRRVKLGRQGDQHWEVIEGLEESERVVTSGNVLIDAQAQFNQDPGAGDAEAEPAVVEEGTTGHDSQPNAADASAMIMTDRAAPASVSPGAKPPPTHADPSIPAAPERASPGRGTGGFTPQVAAAMQDRLKELQSTKNPGTPASQPQAALSLSEGQHKALIDFLAVASGISQTLAADHLESFNQHLAKLPAILEALQKEFHAPHRWSGLIQRLATQPAWTTEKDLASARKRFLSFSTVVVEWVQQLRKETREFAGLKVYHCPMAPKPGLWFQAKGPLRNPFYGAEMLTCGEEVQP
jgi:Cu(I)/Ag(I) efflux system membrane fusion protein